MTRKWRTISSRWQRQDPWVSPRERRGDRNEVEASSWGASRLRPEEYNQFKGGFEALAFRRQALWRGWAEVEGWRIHVSFAGEKRMWRLRCFVGESSMHNRRYPTLVSMIPRYQYLSINDTQSLVSMIPRYQYPSINDTQNRVSMIPWYQYPSINDTQNRVSIIHRTSNNRQIVSPWTFLAKPSNTDKSFHLQLLTKTWNTDKSFHPQLYSQTIRHGQIVSPWTFEDKKPYFNKCPKTIVLAFKKHQFGTLVKNTIFRATDPKTLKKMTPYRIKNWICPAICILTVWSKKWTKTFLTKWRKHYTNPATLKIHQSQHPQDGNPTELTTRTIRPQLFFKVLSKEIINPFHLSRLRTNHH